jgi:hypothetical protein
MLNPVTVLYQTKPAYRAPGALEGTQLAQFANSAAPGAASLSNTTPSYTTLGGKFLFASIVGAETDHVIFGYTTPATHRLIISGIAISTAVSVALTTTASLIEWGLGVNATAVSLATSDSGSTYGPRRIALGTQGFVASAAVGIMGADIVRQFDSPLITEPGRFLTVIMREPVGAATGSFRGSVTFDGYFEATGDTF